MISAMDLAVEAGVTYRQFDYWVEQGFVHAKDEDRPGSGNHRSFSGVEAEICLLMARLVSVGFTPTKAAEIARSMIKNHMNSKFIGNGLLIQNFR